MTHKERAGLATRLLLLFAIVLLFASTASAEWNEKVLYSFQGGANDGFFPAGGVVFDKQGNLYGATTGGGPPTCAPFGSECGTVFQLSPPAQKGGSWTETLLYQFQGKGSNDGSVPNGGLIIDAAGNLYGVTAYGGTGYCLLLGANAGCGTVYEISPPQQQGGAWTETILYSFPTAKEGYLAIGNLVFDDAGNLYGATWFGGDKGTTCDSLYGGQCGTVFELSPPKTAGGTWTERVLHSFAGGVKGEKSGDGALPNGGLVVDSKGAVYGTTYYGGNDAGDCEYGVEGIGCGTAFELNPPAKKGSAWTERMLRRFDATDGANPDAGMTFDSDGNLYGVTVGTLFRLAPPKKSGLWEETTLYAFCGGGEGGCDPRGSLIFDNSGSLYGTTYYGYGSELYGSVFRLKPATKKAGKWVIDYLYGFVNAPDGLYPAARLVFDKAGNLYSTTTGGGRGTCSRYCGTVFEVKP